MSSVGVITKYANLSLPSTAEAFINYMKVVHFQFVQLYASLNIQQTLIQRTISLEAGVVPVSASNNMYGIKMHYQAHMISLRNKIREHAM